MPSASSKKTSLRYDETDNCAHPRLKELSSSLSLNSINGKTLEAFDYSRATAVLDNAVNATSGAAFLWIGIAVDHMVCAGSHTSKHENG
jgi:hypothetical protein